MSSPSDVSGIISNAITQANTTNAQAQTLVTTAQSAAIIGFTFGEPADVTAPVIDIPNFDFNTDLSGQFMSDFGTIWSDFNSWVQGAMGTYMNTYFPPFNPAVPTAEDNWLLNVINNGYVGIPIAVEQAMWDRAKAKDAIESLRLEDEATTQFSSRGFAMPPGILVNRLLNIQQEAANKASTVGRDLAIKQAEISVDMTKHAITEITKIRIGIAEALANFIKAWMAIPIAAADVAKARAEVAKIMWEAIGTYVHAVVEKGDIDLKASIANQSKDMRFDELTVTAGLGLVKEKTMAAVEGAKTLASIASAYASSTNALSSLSQNQNT